MPRSRPLVTWAPTEPGKIPDTLTAGVALVEDLAAREQLTVLADRVRIRREGGFAGFDVLLYLLYYFMSRQRTGLKRFWDLAGPYGAQLAGVALRTALPTPSSVSRALDQVQLELVRPVISWLLGEMSGIDQVLRHKSAHTYDALRQPWQVFDFDPTIHALRHRALPEGSDLPAARRRSARIAAPGYAGRKRGDVQIRRATLQHAGSAAWLGCWLSPGNSERAEGFDHALDVVVDTCARLGQPLHHALIRSDGEFGWVPYYAACRARGVPFLTRLTRPQVFDDPEVRKRLAEAAWYDVPDSRSGPRRSAADLGLITIRAGRDTMRPDGTPYDPIEVRVVVSRLPRDKDPDHGVVLDGWQYELFAADLDPDAWPPEAVVAGYFARGGQENRFAQEDHEVGLDRIFSYELAGQELAVNIGLWLWNIRIARGFELDPPKDVAPPQARYVPRVDRRQTVKVTAEHESTPSPSTLPAPTAPAAMGPITLVGHILGGLDWASMLAKRPGWTFDVSNGEVVCADSRRLALATVRHKEHTPGSTSVVFQRPPDGCAGCPAHVRCKTISRNRRARALSITVPTAAAAQLQEYLQPDDAEDRGVRVVSALPDEPRFSLTAPPVPRKRGRQVAGPLFLPARARWAFDDTTRGMSVSIGTAALPRRSRPHPLVARSAAERQHRRMSWSEHLARYALAPGCEPTISLAGGHGIPRWIGPPPPTADRRRVKHRLDRRG